MEYSAFSQADYQVEYNRWVGDCGDLTHRVNYELNSSSVVVDLGGHKGYWTDHINKKFGCNIYILEPLKNFYIEIVDKFKEFDNIIPINVALLNKTEEVEMSIKGDMSSLFDPGEINEVVKCLDIKEFIDTYKIDKIDVLKINIEGSEYDLLERIIELNLHTNIKNLQIQFHRIIENCDSKRTKIQNALLQTHKCTWNYNFVWENWQIK